MKQSVLFVAAIGATITLSACKKDKDADETTSSATKKEILDGISLNVTVATYTDLAAKGQAFYDEVSDFVANPTAEGLENCRQLWKDARSAWEKSEGFLYGPVASENIDPRIDTWPVDYTALENEINGSTDFTVDANIDALDDALKGFHPIEYLMWGSDGGKQYTEFTTREKEYLLALAKNLKTLTTNLAAYWDTTSSASYYATITNPGSSNATYPTNKAAFEEIVNGMIGICDEVANGKISEPFIQQDPTLEESAYSQNSITDFTNNMISVQNVYLGKYSTDGYGLEDLVRQYNLSLDNTIKSKITAAITALGNITDPFGTAITTQAPQVQLAIDAINDLNTTLEEQLLPFVQQYVTD